MAEQYSWISANNEGYSAGKFSDVDGNIMPWSRSTVADGKWLNREMLLPFSGRDQYLLDSLNQTYDECSAFSGYLNEEIRIINARADVIDVVGTHDAFAARSAELVSGVDISDRDVIKILNDVGTDIPVWIYNTESNVYVESTVSPSNQQTYYRWLSAVNDGPSGWEYVGDLEPYYKDIDLTENSITFENTAPERDYTINTDLNRFVQMTSAGNTGTIGITDDFISSASQVYNALSSISGINEGSISGPRVNHTVSNYSFAQGSANSASYDSFAQGKRNEANGQSIAAGVDNYAKNQSQALGSTNSATSDGFAVGSNNSATTASFAQGSTNYAYNSSLAQGTSNSALTQSFAQGKDNLADYDAFAQGLSASADNESLAQGLEVTAKSKSLAQGATAYANNEGLAQGLEVTAEYRSFAQGENNKATYNSVAIGNSNSADFQSFAVGTDNIGKYEGFSHGKNNESNADSLAQGDGNSAKTRSLAQGLNNYADTYSLAQGQGNNAKTYSLAQGISNSAKSYAAAFGTGNNASETAITQGNANTASCQSIAIGNTNSAYLDSFAQGTNNVATNKSLAQGYNITATDYAFGQGSANTVEEYSFAQGANNTAQYTAFAQGNTNNVTGNAFGQGLSNTAMTDALAQGSINDAEIDSFAQGKENIAISYSFAQGYKNKVNSDNYPLGASFAQGYINTACRISFAQGSNNDADDKSFAQGSANTAYANGFARGLRNHADGGFANGADNIAVGTGALAIGANNYAGTYAQALGHGVKMVDSTNTPAHGGMAIGAFNKTTADLAFVIGNGLDDSRRSDLYWIDYSGNVFTSGNISAKNFYINGNPIDSVVSAKFSAYNGSNTPLTSYPISSFGLYANTAKYITVATANNNRLDFSVADALINSASSGYQAKQWINTNGDGIIGSAKSGAAASAWIASNGATFMPKSQTFAAKGNPNSFNTTFSYTGFTLSAGEGIGFYNAGTNSLGISAQAGIPDGTIVYQGITGYNVVGEKNLSKLCITDYVTATRSYQQLEYSAGITTNKFNLWPTTASTAANLVDGTIIPVIDPIGRYKNEYTTLSQLGEALNIGNYVSAGNNQKLTIMSAENLTLANMQPGVIYLV